MSKDSTLQQWRKNASQDACEIIQAATGKDVKVLSFQPVTGGDINLAIRLNTNIGPYFVKFNPSKFGESILACEIDGLERLDDGPLRIARVIGDKETYPPFVLVLEWIETGQPATDFLENLGRGLAQIHLSSTRQKFGLELANWIGSTPQENKWHDSWIEFWREQRLAWQLDLAYANQQIDVATRKEGERLCLVLDQILIEPESGALLHGDLWSGNYMCDDAGQPVLIDPAVYYGHSEAEFGIIQLFGGFPEQFHDAYHECIPQADGFADRVEIYKLYHLLNHLNLFGASYLDACLRIIRRFT